MTTIHAAHGPISDLEIIPPRRVAWQATAPIIDLRSTSPGFAPKTTTDRDQPGGERGDTMLKTDVTVDNEVLRTTRRAERFRRVWLFDLPFVDAETAAEVAAALSKTDTADGDLRLPIVVTPNVDHIVQLSEPDCDPAIAETFRNSRWVLPDGQPIVALSKRMGTPLSARLPGSTLFEFLWNRVASEGAPSVVIAPRRDVAEGLAAEHELCRFIIPPLFSMDDDVAIKAIADACIEHAIEERPRFVFSGLSFGKDQLLAKQILEQWPVAAGSPPIVLCLGASFEMYLGMRKRAPEIVQRLGMEWLYRFTQEPKRLFHRYFVRDRAFFGLARAELKRR